MFPRTIGDVISYLGEQPLNSFQKAVATMNRSLNLNKLQYF